MNLNITVVDYGIGNIRSITNALKKFNITPTVSNNKNIILNSDGIILPGVGAFKHGMKNLKEYNLIETLNEYVKLDKPLLGICLGMQMLFNYSHEHGIEKGLGFIEGEVVLLPLNNPNQIKLPHVSWNEIQKSQTEWKGTILEGIKKDSDMYFVHSFIVIPKDKNSILSTTNYSNYTFCSSVKKGNIYGCQFHPEKSSKEGLNIIKNFINLCKDYEK